MFSLLSQRSRLSVKLSRISVFVSQIFRQEDSMCDHIRESSYYEFPIQLYHVNVDGAISLYVIQL